MQNPLQVLITGGIMGRVHGSVVLAEKLGTLTLREIPQNHLGITRIPARDRLGCHDADCTGPKRQARQRGT